MNSSAALPSLHFHAPPWQLSGVVYGALLNHAPQLAALGDAVNQPPYKAPPAHPVLQVKPRHTLAGEGDALVVPAGCEAIEVGATLGIVIGRSACRVAVDEALACVAGYLVANDVSVPQASHYRPAVRWRARDGFCPLGSLVVPAAQVGAPDALAVRIDIDGRTVQRTDTGDRVRGVARLIADVSGFMTLRPGDVLLLGASHGAPLARPGQRVAISIEPLGSLSNPVVAEAAEALA